MAYNFPDSPTTGQTVTAPTGQFRWDGVKWVLLGPTAYATPSNPNKLINPFMEIDQANEGAALTLNNTVQSVRIIDGFISNFTSSTSTATASTGRYSTVPPPGYTYNLVHQTGSPATAVAAGDYMQVYQAIEADELCD